MPVIDLLARTRRILGKLFGRTRRSALAAALVPLGAVGMSPASAAPNVALPPEFPAAPFSVRVTDMERVPGDLEGDAFRIEVEVLNWAHYTAHSFAMTANNGSTAVDGGAPIISGASIDADGRGGAPGGSDIGSGVFDPVAIHSGRGRGDVDNRLNDWLVQPGSSTLAHWSAYDTVAGDFPLGSFIHGIDLLVPSRTPTSVPGYGLDALGDSAMDGGPGPYSPIDDPGGGEPSTFFHMVRDGFVIDVDDWDVGETFSVNWFLAAVPNTSAGLDPISNPLELLDGPFGRGVMNLVRLEPTIGADAGVLPGPVFEGNVGFDQSNFSFYDTVYEIPNPAEFAAEFGTGITAPFLNPNDNLFGATVNTQLIGVPEPAGAVIVACGLFGVAVVAGRSRFKR